MLSFYVVKDWREGCERCIQILRYGGMGHTMSIHSQNDEVILQFGLKKPAFRICVNTPTTHGSIGLTTGLDPAMTLGCGGWGGNITSDNISPRHLLNIKRLAYEFRPATDPAAAAVRSGGAEPPDPRSRTGLAAPKGSAETAAGGYSGPDARRRASTASWSQGVTAAPADKRRSQAALCSPRRVRQPRTSRRIRLRGRCTGGDEGRPKGPH